ncbi:MAG: glycosyltransferase family 39 protein, partial [Anaerolineales bacterium]|nr:glycosyltransferase family 39 protein [Anaerolineales bacterium]
MTSSSPLAPRAAETERQDSPGAERSSNPSYFCGMREKVALLLLVLLAFALRIAWLDSVPPGWRDDELINSLVISQKVLDGDLAVYYADASGHEALYHALNALFLGAFGPGVPGIRWLSVLLGTLAVPLTYLVGRRMFGRMAGWVAAGGLTFSFWSLMYSRIGLRHILLPLLVLAAFYFFWQPLVEKKEQGEASRAGRSLLALLRAAGLTAVFMALGFYTYFAG